MPWTKRNFATQFGSINYYIVIDSRSPSARKLGTSLYQY